MLICLLSNMIKLLIRKIHQPCLLLKPNDCMCYIVDVGDMKLWLITYHHLSKNAYMF